MAQALYPRPFGRGIEESKRLIMANANHPSHYQRTARILTVACGLLFFAFSFVYLYVFQARVLEALHYSLADGKTQFWAFGCAFVLSVVLMLLRWGVNAVLGLKGAIRTLSYFPSFLLLGVMTDVDYSLYQDGISSAWAWKFPLFLALFLVMAFVLRRLLRWWLDIEIDSGVMTISNLGILLIFSLMTVSIGNTDIHFQHRLSVEQALREGRWDDVRRIGAKVVDPDRPLTVLRHYALSRNGQLGEYLFQMPQLYGAEGLLPDASDSRVLRFTPDTLYHYLGGRPQAGERAVDFFHRLCHEETGNHTTLDYYLSALLLDGQLNAFVEPLRTLSVDAPDSLPRHYREALFLYEQLHPSVTPTVTDEAMRQQWESYQALKQELRGKVEETNFMRREFGHTFWWYYEYSNL